MSPQEMAEYYAKLRALPPSTKPLVTPRSTKRQTAAAMKPIAIKARWLVWLMSA